MALDQNFGIDFGTSNSSVVHYAEYAGKLEEFMYGDDEGRPMPSVVAIEKGGSGKVHTGRDAWKQRSQLKETCECVNSVKAHLNDSKWRLPVDGRDWTAEDLACEVLKELKASVEKSRDNSEAPVSEPSVNMSVATMAIPIGLSAHARKTLRAAAKRAGIEVEAFVSEPTAAFFANYEELKGAEHVVIFDWGGGTLDVSVLHHSDGRLTELSSNGMNVAGDYIDELLAQKVHAKISHDKQNNIAFDEMDPHDRDQLIVRCERAKRALSEEDEAPIRLNRYGELGLVRMTVTYEWLEEVVSSTIDKAMACLDKAIDQSGEPEGNIDRVVLVGGSSNLGPLYERMEARFGDKLYYPDDTVWSISKGAARLSRQPGGYHAAQDVGIVLADGSYFPLLREGDDIKGWKKSIDFGITDTSETLRVVFSGSRDIDDSDTRFKLIDVPGYVFMQERLQLNAWIDEDRIFRVHMKSSMRRDRDARVWEYDKLKLSYGLEGWKF